MRSAALIVAVHEHIEDIADAISGFGGIHKTSDLGRAIESFGVISDGSSAFRDGDSFALFFEHEFKMTERLGEAFFF